MFTVLPRTLPTQFSCLVRYLTRLPLKHRRPVQCKVCQVLFIVNSIHSTSTSVQLYCAKQKKKSKRFKLPLHNEKFIFLYFFYKQFDLDQFIFYVMKRKRSIICCIKGAISSVFFKGKNNNRINVFHLNSSNVEKKYL